MDVSNVNWDTWRTSGKLNLMTIFPDDESAKQRKAEHPAFRTSLFGAASVIGQIIFECLVKDGDPDDNAITQLETLSGKKLSKLSRGYQAQYEAGAAWSFTSGSLDKIADNDTQHAKPGGHG